MLFERDHRRTGAEARRIHAIYEILYTVVDFTAAGLFVIGSFMFLSPAWTETGTWLFIVGSFCFAAKPSIRLVRELQLAARGETRTLADRYED